MMKKKVYFAGSIRGSQADTALYRQLIAHINETAAVLTEHVGDMTRSVQEGSFSADRIIYEQDTAWLKECDIVIAECTGPSTGVGYELAFAEKLGKPVHILYRPEKTNLSAMIKGDSYFIIHPYGTKEEAFAILRTILRSA